MYRAQIKQTKKKERSAKMNKETNVTPQAVRHAR